jgi:hypothetical protein
MWPNRERNVGALAVGFALLLAASSAPHGALAKGGGDVQRRDSSDTGQRVNASLPQPEAVLRKKLLDDYDKVRRAAPGAQRWDPCAAWSHGVHAARACAPAGCGSAPSIRSPYTPRRRRPAWPSFPPARRGDVSKQARRPRF